MAVVKLWWKRVARLERRGIEVLPPVERGSSFAIASAVANRLGRAIVDPSVRFRVQEIVVCYCETAGDSLQAVTLRMGALASCRGTRVGQPYPLDTRQIAEWLHRQRAIGTCCSSSPGMPTCPVLITRYC